MARAGRSRHRWDSRGPIDDLRRLAWPLLLSLAGHVLLLSLSFGDEAFGLPGLAWPWQDRRGSADLQVVLMPAPVVETPTDAAGWPQTPPMPAVPDAPPALPSRPEPEDTEPIAPIAPIAPTAPQSTPAVAEPTPEATARLDTDRLDATPATMRLSRPVLALPRSDRARLGVPNLPLPAASAVIEASRPAIAPSAPNTANADALALAARQEAARQEAARQEAARQEAARQEAARQEAARQEAARQEAARQEAARQEAARLKAAQDDDARREAARRAMGRMLDEEAARRDAAAKAAQAAPAANVANAAGTARRGRLFGRADANAELVLYAEAWARKIQLNLTFDAVREAARRPHTNPVVTVAVRADGSVESVTFVVSSGLAELDEAVRRVVYSQVPYAAFSPALAREFDVVEIRRTWYFDGAVRLY